MGITENTNENILAKQELTANASGERQVIESKIDVRMN